MALFKPFKGNRTDLNGVEKVDGHAYFCVDDGTFWIDHKVGDEVLRTQINKADWTKDIEEAIAALNIEDLNIENGSGEISIQQSPRPDKIHDINGKDCFTISAEMSDKAGISSEVEYGAVGNYTATLNGRSSAQAKHATAIGNSTVALGEESFAQGYQAIAKGGSSMAAGSNVYAAGEASVAHGSKTEALAEYTFAGGVHTVAGYPYQTVVGVANENHHGNIFEVGCGLLEEDGSVALNDDGEEVRRNALSVVRDGRVKVYNGHYNLEANDVVDYYALTQVMNKVPSNLRNGQRGEFSLQQQDSTATGNYDVVLGYTSRTENYTGSKEPGYNSNTERAVRFVAGMGNIASGPQSAVFGRDSQALGIQAIAGGNTAEAKGDYSVAFGKDVHAQSQASIAMGIECISIDKGAVSLGDGAEANGHASVALGCAPKATSDFAVATGYYTIASGTGSFAGGVRSEASGAHACAIGTDLIAGQVYQAVFGCANKDEQDTIFIVGNGTPAINEADPTRSNAFEIYKDGRAKVYGTPKDSTDVLRKIDLTNFAATDSEINAIFG